jgi:hypothetical protein
VRAPVARRRACTGGLLSVLSWEARGAGPAAPQPAAANAKSSTQTRLSRAILNLA